MAVGSSSMSPVIVEIKFRQIKKHDSQLNLSKVKILIKQNMFHN